MCADKDQESLAKNVDMSSMPPCKRSLVQHVQRVNYQVGIWKRSYIAEPDIPDPEGHNWRIAEELLQPLWYDGQEIPDQLVEDTDEDNYGSNDDSDVEMYSGLQENNINSDSDDYWTLWYNYMSYLLEDHYLCWIYMLICCEDL